MRKLSALVLAGVLLAATGLGCHGRQDEGKNRNQDKPAPKAEGRSTPAERMTKPQ